MEELRGFNENKCLLARGIRYWLKDLGLENWELKYLGVENWKN